MSSCGPDRHRAARASAIIGAVCVAACARGASAHAGDPGFVLLLPTGFWTAGGVAAVALTVAAVALLPGGAAARLFRAFPFARACRMPGRTVVSCLSAAALFALVRVGLTGTQDPGRNPLPLVVWTVGWIGLVLVQGVAGDVWRWVSPWDGPVAVARKLVPRSARPRLPPRLGHWPALAGLFAVAAFLLVDPTPAAPERLARIALGWWVLHFLAALAFGPRWLRRAEPFGVLLRGYAGLAPVGRGGGRWGGRWCAGLPGWRILSRPVPDLSLAFFFIAMLALGSYDGLYETFWWFGLTGENPLEFAGRSAVVGVNLAGLALALPVLGLGYAAAVGIGVAMVPDPPRFGAAFRALAPALLPVAFVYHASHYLPALLVDGQRALIALSDPFGAGWNLFGWRDARVTTGFFNRLGSVRLIWLAQAALIVAGHVLALLISHAVALGLTGDARRAVAMQLPLALFMVAYTLFGLWLLAAPRGA